MKRAKVWSVVAEDVKMDRENTGAIARVLTAEQKKRSSRLPQAKMNGWPFTAPPFWPLAPHVAA